MLEGMTRMAVADDVAARSEELAEVGAELAAEGVAELAGASVLREATAELAEEGIAQVATGAADIGAADALHATAEAFEDQADEEEEW
jgi:hypothetical protein